MVNEISKKLMKQICMVKTGKTMVKALSATAMTATAGLLGTSGGIQ